MSVGVMEDYKLRDFGRIIVVLEPVPRKSEDVIIILLSLILGRGHFDPVKDRTDDFLGEEVDTVTRSRWGTCRTDGVFESPIPCSPDDGWDHCVISSIRKCRVLGYPQRYHCTTRQLLETRSSHS